MASALRLLCGFKYMRVGVQTMRPGGKTRNRRQGKTAMLPLRTEASRDRGGEVSKRIAISYGNGSGLYGQVHEKNEENCQISNGQAG
ncbi:MAG: hypothetical protein PHY64_14665, partial [Eubacteriales bacterium]|nr:hypothetical protein [Eubacteriales bacterium]